MSKHTFVYIFTQAHFCCTMDNARSYCLLFSSNQRIGIFLKSHKCIIRLKVCRRYRTGLTLFMSYGIFHFFDTKKCSLTRIQKIDSGDAVQKNPPVDENIVLFCEATKQRLQASCAALFTFLLFDVRC